MPTSKWQEFLEQSTHLCFFFPTKVTKIRTVFLLVIWLFGRTLATATAENIRCWFMNLFSRIFNTLWRFTSSSSRGSTWSSSQWEAHKGRIIPEARFKFDKYDARLKFDQSIEHGLVLFTLNHLDWTQNRVPTRSSPTYSEKMYTCQSSMIVLQVKLLINSTNYKINNQNQPGQQDKDQSCHTRRTIVSSFHHCKYVSWYFRALKFSHCMEYTDFEDINQDKTNLRIALALLIFLNISSASALSGFLSGWYLQFGNLSPVLFWTYQIILECKPAILLLDIFWCRVLRDV